MEKVKTVGSLVDGLSRWGGKTAVQVFQKTGARRWSYERLADHALRLAAGLRRSGLEEGETAALLAGVRFESIAVGLGVVRAGGVIMPLDVQIDEELLGTLLADSGARIVFTTADYLERVRGVDTAEPLTIYTLDEAGDGPAGATGWEALLAETAGDLPEIDPEDRAVLFYTSGTTGPPKGVPLTHANLAFQLNTVIREELVTEKDRVLLPLPLHHVYPFVIGTLVPLSLGLTIVVPHALTGPQILRAAGEGAATAIIGVPRLYRALYAGIEAQAESGGRMAAALFHAALAVCVRARQRLGLRLGRFLLKPIHGRLGSQLEILASGGAPLDPELMLKLEGLGWKVAVGYGLTETAPLLTINPPGRARIGSVGRVVEGVRIRLDRSAAPDDMGNSGRPDQGPDLGEILAWGPNVFSGYHNLPEKSREVLTEDGGFRTGDLGWFDGEGYLYVQGRVSTLIVTEGGENIQPETVEEVLDDHPFIRETGILQIEGRLAAVIVPDMSEIRRGGREDIETTVQKAVAEQSRKLPSYQRLSDYAVSRESLARTRIGKIRRHLLPRRYEEAKRAGGMGGGGTGPIPIREMSDQDRALLEDPAAREAWNWLAEQYPEHRLTPDAAMGLDLGVDSLEWLHITMEIRRRAGVELDEEAVAGIDSVRDLLQTVSEQSGSAPRPDRISPSLDDPRAALSERQKRWLQPLSPGERRIGGALFGLNRLLAGWLFDLEIRGRENLSDADQVVFAPNHVSYLDAFVLAASFSFERMNRTYWAGWTGAAFANPLNRFVSRLAQTVPIDPDKGVFSSLAFAAAVLEQGENLVWFPEGRRSPTGELLPFKPGIGILLERSRAPVVPVFIQGTADAMPVGQFLIRPARVRVTFGEPVAAETLEREGRGDEPRTRIVEGLRGRVAALGEASR